MKTGACKLCGVEFSSFIAEQQHCSACNDIRSGQQSIAVEHETLNEWPVLLGFSPKWKPCGPLYGHSFVYKGKEHGPVWMGRFTLYSPTDPPRAGAQVLLQQRQSVHLVRVRKETRIRYDYEISQTVEYKKNIYLPICDLSREQRLEWVKMARGGKFLRIELPDGTLITTEARVYYVLFPSHAEPEYRFVAVEEGYNKIDGWRMEMDLPADRIVLEIVEGCDPLGRFSRTTHYALIPPDAVAEQIRYSKNDIQRRTIGNG